MKKYDVISLDMFQTLVDVNRRIPQIWQAIMETEYSEEKAKLAARTLVANLPAAYKHSIDPFRDMEGLYMECAENMVKQAGFAVEPKKIVDSLLYQHGQSPFYSEVLSVLEELSGDYTIILSSDASHLMVDPILARCKIARVFISDDLECYKGDASGKFFKTVVSELNISPDRIIHIGDSAADIIGAQAAGMDSCLINRTGKARKAGVNPKYEITSLEQLKKIVRES